MNLWHTSHSNIRVMRCICRWRSNMVFVLQTKLQKTHSNPERTKAGCTDARGRGTRGQEWGAQPLPPSPPHPPRLYPSRHCSLRLRTARGGEHAGVKSISHSPLATPYMDANQAPKWKIFDATVLRPIYLFSNLASLKGSLCSRPGYSARAGRLEQAIPPPPLPFSGFSSLFSEGWLPGTTEMTSRLFPLLFFWEPSESSLLLAESLRADREEEEGLFDSLGVFLSSPGKTKQNKT